MKLLLILLVFTLLSSSFAVKLTSAQFEQDLNNFEHLNFGVDQLLERGRQAGKIVNNLFDITRIYTISYEQSGSQDYYDFEIQLDDSQESVIKATLRVQVEGGQATSLISFSYNVTNTTSGTNEVGTDSDETGSAIVIPEEEFIIVPVEESPETEVEIVVPADEFIVVPVEESPDIEVESAVPVVESVDEKDQALNFGVDAVLQIGYNSGKIPTGEDYQVTKINSVDERTGNNRMYYDFDVEVTNSEGNIVIQMTFTVRKTSDGEMEVISFNYIVRKTATTTRPTGGSQTNSGGTDQPEQGQEDQDVEEALNFGVDSVLQIGYNSGKIPTGENYEVTKRNSVNQSSRNNRRYYEFDVEVANSEGNIVIQMTLTVRRSSNGEMEVTAFNYTVRKTTTTTTTTRKTN